MAVRGFQCVGEVAPRARPLELEGRTRAQERGWTGAFSWGKGGKWGDQKTTQGSFKGQIKREVTWRLSQGGDGSPHKGVLHVVTSFTQVPRVPIASPLKEGWQAAET